MKIKGEFVLRKVAGSYVAVAVGETHAAFHGMIKLNETGKAVWDGVMEGLSDAEIAARLAAQYGAPQSTTLEDVKALLAQLDAAGLLEK